MPPHLDVDSLVSDLRQQLSSILGDNLVGIYIFGSVASFSYDPGVSDVDLLVVTADPLGEADYAELNLLHARLAENELWADRIEVAYLPRQALRTFRERTTEIGIVHPGEPFHQVQAGKDWLMNWYDVREHAIVVVGPEPTTLIDPITAPELQTCIHDYLRLFPDRVRSSRHRGSDAYAVLTMCRGLHTVIVGTSASKTAAADWAAATYPSWRGLILEAKGWRLAADNKAMNTAETPARVEAFVAFTIRTLAGLSGQEEAQPVDGA